MTWQIFEGDCREVLRELPAGMVQMCVTSPPYFGLRDYGHNGQIGLEPTPDEYVAGLVDVFREVRRVLRDDGTVWLNLGDSYAAGKAGRSDEDTIRVIDAESGRRPLAGSYPANDAGGIVQRKPPPGYKPKDLLGVPWLVAFALRADGWYLRSDIIWAKPNPMPESVTDRPTKAHEYLFLLSKSARYFYDADAIREAVTCADDYRGHERMEPEWSDRSRRGITPGPSQGHLGIPLGGRNKRSVWTVATQPYSGAHFATFPAKLIEPCILAGSPPKCCGECGAPWWRVVERTAGPAATRGEQSWTNGSGTFQRDNPGGGISNLSGEARTVGWESTCAHDDDSGRSIVLDPFAGSGTTGVVAGQLGRDFVGIELNPEYARLARERILIEGRPGSRNHDPVQVHADQLGLL